MKKQIFIGIKLFLLMLLVLGLAACECEFKDITTDGLPTGTVGVLTMQTSISKLKTAVWTGAAHGWISVNFHPGIVLRHKEIFQVHLLLPVYILLQWLLKSVLKPKVVIVMKRVKDS